MWKREGGEGCITVVVPCYDSCYIVECLEKVGGRRVAFLASYCAHRLMILMKFQQLRFALPYLVRLLVCIIKLASAVVHCLRI